MLTRVVVLLFFWCGISLAAPAQTPFPDRCLGVWKGTLHLYNQGVVKDSVPVRMTVARTADPAVWAWKTEYLSAKNPVVKDYALKLTDKAANRYVTDEGNGILLDTYLVGNKLYNVFEVSGNLLTATYERVGESLIFEVTSGKKGETTGEGVVNYTVRNVQRVVFRKEK